MTPEPVLLRRERSSELYSWEAVLLSMHMESGIKEIFNWKDRACPEFQPTRCLYLSLKTADYSVFESERIGYKETELH